MTTHEQEALPNDLLQIYARSFHDNWDLPALTDYGSADVISYGELARRIARLHLLYRLLGIKRGDKIALMGRNTSGWVVVFMATITYGAVIVPVLQDFSAQDAQHILHHSDARLLFVNASIWENMEAGLLPRIEAVFSLDETVLLADRGGRAKRMLSALGRKFKSEYRSGYNRESISYPALPADSVAVINYTSGTTGFSKGVMLTLDNLNGNVTFGINAGLLHQGSRMLSFLPLAHAYGCAFDMLTALAAGAHVTLLCNLPTPKLLLKAMSDVKPNLVLCVPLILEKIYKKQIMPMLSKRSVRVALSLPLIDSALYSRIRSKLIEAFGGEFESVIVGGAPLNSDVERFLHRIKFPFSVGYGMTECGPLISYTPWREFKVGSSGRTLPCMESKIERPADAEAHELSAMDVGEICVRGQNVMKGYYKNPEATAAVIDKDGWLHTGDMGTRTADGTLYIRGRYKTMILTATGQNIYPEEIEAKLNNMPYVAESLIVDRQGHLTALIYPDYEAMDAENLVSYQLDSIMNANIAELNKLVAPYEKVEGFKLVPNEFEKTPKRSIKRFLYS